MTMISRARRCGSNCGWPRTVPVMDFLLIEARNEHGHGEIPWSWRQGRWSSVVDKFGIGVSGNGCRRRCDRGQAGGWVAGRAGSHTPCFPSSHGSLEETTTGRPSAGGCPNRPPKEDHDPRERPEHHWHQRMRYRSIAGLTVERSTILKNHTSAQPRKNSLPAPGEEATKTDGETRLQHRVPLKAASG